MVCRVLIEHDLMAVATNGEIDLALLEAMRDDAKRVAGTDEFGVSPAGTTASPGTDPPRRAPSTFVPLGSEGQSPLHSEHIL